MSFCRFLLFFVTGSFLLLGHIAPAKAQAPSFDCAKATTPVERLICGSPSLADLDAQLAGAVKKALAASPAQRDSLLAAERRWTRDRDKECPMIQSGPLEAHERAPAITCLAEAYRARIGALQSSDANPLAEPSANGKTEVCRKIADRYRALVKTNPQAPYAKSFNAETPLKVLAAAKGSGVTIAKPVVEAVPDREFFDWAKRSPQSFVLPAEILDEIIEEASISHYLRVDRLPGSNYFAASTIEGTGHYYRGVYFEVEKGRAHLAAAPNGWEEGSPSDDYLFGMVDGTPVAFLDQPGWVGEGFGFSLTSYLTVMPWRKDHFDPACVVTFQFSPRFDLHGGVNPGHEDDSCDGADCDELRRAALALVEEAEKNPLEAPKTAIARLTPSQRDAFAALLKERGTTVEDASDPHYAPDTELFTDQTSYCCRLCMRGKSISPALAISRSAGESMPIGASSSKGWKAAS
jgi:uncharacterized protein